MNDEGYIWGEASVTYPDWKGTAQLDVRMAARPIGEMVGLDPAQWRVIGLNIGGGEHGHQLRVVAIPADNNPEGGDIFPKIAEANGGDLLATEFLIHDVDPYEVLRKITNLFDFRLRVGRLAGDDGIPIRIVAYGDRPEQDWQ